MIHESFPMYRDFDPLVPVWCLTDDVSGCIHRFFDSSSISPSGRYVAVFQLPFEDRQPHPGESGVVWLIDLETGTKRPLSKTCGWEPQLGANINWGATDHELFFNDVDVSEWRPYSWKMDPLTDIKQKMDGTVYHVTRDGKLLVSANLSLLRKTQNGYGVVLPDNLVTNSVGLREDEGYYITDTQSGKQKLLVSLNELVRNAMPFLDLNEMEQCEIYGFHCTFNPQGTKLLFQLRWFPKRAPNSWNMNEFDYKSIRRSFITMSLDKKLTYCVITPDQEYKGSHHATWFPDGEHISLNLKIDGTVMRFASVRYDGSELQTLVKGVRGSGHPTVHRSGHVLTDTYLQRWDFPQYGDGTVPLRWINTASGDEHVPIRINVKQPCTDPTLRIDPHPAWDRSGRYILFNGYADGSRRVYLADMRRMITRDNLPTPIRKADKGTRSLVQLGRSIRSRMVARQQTIKGNSAVKVFQIGFNRCGTTSLYKFFSSNNHKSLHWQDKSGKQSGRNIALLAHENMWSKNKKIFDGIEDYVFYSDMEFVSQYLITNVYEHFKIIDRDYPGSKFILNIRDRDDWLNSRFNHGTLPSHEYSPYAERFMEYYQVSPSQLKQMWIRHFEEHISRVLDYFSNRQDNLLIFKLGETDIKEVVAFLPELQFNNLEFMRSNTGPSRELKS